MTYESRPGGRQGDARAADQPKATSRKAAILEEARRAGATLEVRNGQTVIVTAPPKPKRRSK